MPRNESVMLQTLRRIHDSGGITTHQLAIDTNASDAVIEWRVNALIHRDWAKKVDGLLHCTQVGRLKLGVEVDEETQLRNRVRELEDELADATLELATVRRERDRLRRERTEAA